MARIRTIKPLFWDDEIVGAMPATTRLAFVGLFSLADDEGRLPGRAIGVRNKLFMYDEATTTDDVERALLQLHHARRIRLYGDASQRFIEVVNFAKHQRIQKPQPSQLPAPSSKYPVLPIEGGDEQAITLPVDDHSDTSTTGNGMEWNGETHSSPVKPATGLVVLADGLGKVTKARKPAVVDPQVAACFRWYCDLWGKVGPFSLELTAKRQRAIEKALKKHGPEKVAAVIRGHHSNDWRHGQLNRNDISVLLRDDNIDAGVELAAKAAGLRQSVGGASSSELERMGY